MTNTPPCVICTYPVPHVFQVILNRPERRNALNLELRRALADAFSAASQDTGIRVIVITGGAKSFAAGADLSELQSATPIEMHQRGLHRLWKAIADCPKPVIAAVEGYALGGGLELAMHADVTIVGAGAKLGQTEVRVGLMPGAGGVQRLTRLVGRQRAMRMVLSGEIVSGEEAVAMGLAGQIAPDGEVEAHALKLAEHIAKMPPLALEQIKEVVNAGADLSLEAALTLERKAFQLLFASDDMREGIAAFFEKREPNYRGA